MNMLSSRSPWMQRIQSALARPLTYVGAGGGVLLLDYATGRFIMFPILFVIPVTFAAWFYSKRAAYLLALLLPLGRFIIARFFDDPAPSSSSRLMRSSESLYSASSHFSLPGLPARARN